MFFIQELCNFQTSKRLAKRGFNVFFNVVGARAEFYYDKKGNITDEVTEYPCVSYAIIARWLDLIGINVVVERKPDNPFLFGSIYVKTDKVNAEGKTMMVRRGRVKHGTDYTELCKELLVHAIGAVAIIRD